MDLIHPGKTSLKAPNTLMGVVDLARLDMSARHDRHPAPPPGQAQFVEGPGYSFLVRSGESAIARGPSSLCVSLGSVRFDDDQAQQLLQAQGSARAWQHLFGLHGQAALARAHGDYVVIYLDGVRRQLWAAVDRFGIHPLCHTHSGSVLCLASRADEVPGRSIDLDPQALFNYLYHHVIPAPRTIFQGVARLRAAHILCAQGTEVRCERHWTPRFNGEQVAFEHRREAFMGAIEAAVRHHVTGEEHVGCYLSGGTDSSTVTGMACRILNKPVQTFSMGFDAAGYDEMQYARIAAKHFGATHHEYYVTPQDLVTSIPDVAAFYDQPFGNSSALPSYYCARLARDLGVKKMLAGDGGDELFGGNARYVFNQLFAGYEQLPAFLRKGLLEPLALGTPALKQLPIVRKLVRYVEVARMLPPERVELYNLLTAIGAQNVMSEALLAQIQQSEPGEEQARVYAETAHGNSLDRLLAYEWKYVLADTDLPKVVGTASMSNVRVGFPFLDDGLIEVANALPRRDKVRGKKLRVFFKEALKEFLPREIIEKTKHGFGLPFGVWLTRTEQLKRMAEEAIQSLVARKLLRPEFHRSIFQERLHEHAGYYGEMIWILTVLEYWLRAHAPNTRF